MSPSKENCYDGCLAIGRINRFSEQVKPLTQTCTLHQQRPASPKPQTT
ncbi:MAG: hypothetical protein HC796_11300 [Synechococcaceae cyanobacterium RL_1_2]|nr:hypothetical protein [Synechococcaceae cyanobacterium RL_1_2]